MKITKARLKQIIKEELENLDEAGLTTTDDAEKALSFAGDNPMASVRRKEQDAELKRLARKNRGEETDEVKAARQQLIDKGMLKAPRGMSIVRNSGYGIDDVEKALKAMDADAATINTIIRKLDALYY